MSESSSLESAVPGLILPEPRRRESLDLASSGSQIILLQILFTIVWSYELLFSADALLSVESKEWVILGLLALVAALLVLPKGVLETGWMPGVLVVGDTAIASALVYFSGNGVSDLYLTYFLIVLLAATTRSLKQMIWLSVLLCLSYGVVLYLESLTDGALQEGQLLRLPLLLIMAIFYGVTTERVRRVNDEKAGLLDYIAERKQAEEERERLIKELQEAMANIKTLRGFLPICAHCKNIRDDKGYWLSVEEYVRVHAEVDFSHGICPRCLEKHFPS
jgi:two-component system cell cycle sensor histidine kinase/response regulator CckA